MCKYFCLHHYTTFFCENQQIFGNIENKRKVCIGVFLPEKSQNKKSPLGDFASYFILYFPIFHNGSKPKLSAIPPPKGVVCPQLCFSPGRGLCILPCVYASFPFLQLHKNHYLKACSITRLLFYAIHFPTHSQKSCFTNS